jgi:radical SAM protein with 4Fe4S-binding SPASM domain
MDIEAFPLIVGWELTLKCNLRCHHCGSSAGLPRRNELTTGEALALCDQFPDLLVQEVDFTGGESLLRPDWKEIALRLKELRIRTNLLTNGVNLTPEIVGEMIEAGITCVGISIDGLEKSHDFMRGQHGTFNRTIHSLDLLNQSNMNSVIITTVTSLNVDEMPALMEMLLQHGAKGWRLQPLIPLGRVKDSVEFSVDNESILKIGQFIKKNKKKASEKGLDIMEADGLQYIFEEEKTTKEHPWLGCPAGWSTCGITSDGKVKGCLSMPDELVEGDLRKNDLWDIWFNPNAFAYNRKFAQIQLGTNCVDCDMRESCKGGCSASSYAATGNFHNDPCCFYSINSNLIKEK